MFCFVQKSIQPNMCAISFNESIFFQKEKTQFHIYFVNGLAFVCAICNCEYSIYSNIKLSVESFDIRNC